MILVRFVQTFRERCPEWVMACVTTGWGFNAWSDSFQTNVTRHAFDSPFFAPLLATGISQFGWGIYAMLVGALRLTCLYINGSRPRGSSSFRAIGAFFSFVFWLGLLVGAMGLPYASTGRITYGGLVVLDLFGLCFAATDASMAFARAREVAANERE